MTYYITQPCIDTLDQSCVDVCPVDCIHFEEGVDKMLYIDPDECIDCGACEPACPVSAIFAEDDLPPLSPGHDRRVPFVFRLLRDEVPAPYFDQPVSDK